MNYEGNFLVINLLYVLDFYSLYGAKLMFYANWLRNCFFIVAVYVVISIFIFVQYCKYCLNLMNDTCLFWLVVVILFKFYTDC